MFARDSEFTVGRDHEPLELLIRTGPPASGPLGPLALTPVEHERALPPVKHVGEVAKTWFLRRAAVDGFADAAFVDRYGRLGEATIWNLVFWDGEQVIWPEAEMLAGTTQGIVRRQLDRLHVAQRVREVRLSDLPGLSGGAVMNSWTPGVAVSRIGSARLPQAPRSMDPLHEAYQREPLTAP